MGKKEKYRIGNERVLSSGDKKNAHIQIMLMITKATGNKLKRRLKRKTTVVIPCESVFFSSCESFPLNTNCNSSCWLPLDFRYNLVNYNKEMSLQNSIMQ